jgi:hypothetical protein
MNYRKEGGETSHNMSNCHDLIVEATVVPEAAWIFNHSGVVESCRTRRHGNIKIRLYREAVELITGKPSGK